MKVKTWKGWTPRQEAELAELRQQGLSLRAIAERMGRTKASVACAVTRYELPKRTRFEAWYDTLQVIHTLDEAAARMGVKRSSVKTAKSRLRKRGLGVGPAVPRTNQTPNQESS